MTIFIDSDNEYPDSENVMCQFLMPSKQWCRHRPVCGTLFNVLRDALLISAREQAQHRALLCSCCVLCPDFPKEKCECGKMCGKMSLSSITSLMMCTNQDFSGKKKVTRNSSGQNRIHVHHCILKNRHNDRLMRMDVIGVFLFLS